ncbi:MAG: hypothetical protein DHS20C05_06630 [Hyphococcus sp.]|nr:MAG: hypothetical protein DHS20C05_06630 [Marinicaulis sp.]
MKSLTKIFSVEPMQTTDAKGFSLRQRIEKGGTVVFGGHAFSQVLRLISNLILANLLMPEAFGLMAVAVSINIWAAMLTDIGIQTSVIRSANSRDPSFLRTAWTTQFVRNCLIWVLILLAAVGVYALVETGVAPADGVYAHPMLPWIMATIALQLPISGLTSMNQSLAARDLFMGRIIALEVATQLIAILTTITLAFIGLGVWALVFGSLTSTVVKTLASHMFFPGVSMRFHFNRKHFDEIFNFGKWLIIASLFGFLANRGDQVLFGWLMPTDRFSLYAIASIWIMGGMGVISTINNRIVYAAFSELIRERPKDLQRAYKKTRLVFDAAVTAFVVGIFFLAEPVFDLIYPDNYSGVGYFIKLMSPVFLLLPYRLISIAVLAGGDSKSFTLVTVVSGLLMLILVPLMFSLYGEKAAVICFSCIAISSLPIAWRNGARVMAIDSLTEARMLIITAAYLAVMFVWG